MTRDDLLEAMRRGRAEWEELLARVPAARLREPGVEGDWSVADVVAHVAAYELFVGQILIWELRREPRGKVTVFAQEPPDLNGDAYNEWVVEQARGWSAEDVLAEEARAYRLLEAAIAAMPEEDLLEPDRFAWLAGRALAEILPSQAHAHYRMHTTAIKAWLRGSASSR